jgi:hypothetical protein
MGRSDKKQRSKISGYCPFKSSPCSSMCVNRRIRVNMVMHPREHGDVATCTGSSICMYVDVSMCT